MKASHVELPKSVEPRPAQKKSRFQIVKLEERIAPNKGNGQRTLGPYCYGHGHHNGHP